MGVGSRRLTTTLTMLISLLGTLMIRAEEPDRLTRYFEGLRSRGLFVVAEHYASERLDDPDVLEAERVVLAVELSRTYSSHASSLADPEERAAFWQRATDVLAPLAARQDSLRREAVTLQQASLIADRAEFLHWQALVDPEDSEIRSQAAEALNSAIDALANWAKEVAEARAGKSRPSPEELAKGELSPIERNAMRRETELRITSLYLALAEVTDGQTRAAAIVTAGEKLETLRRVAAGSSWETVIELSRLQYLRLSGDEKRLSSSAGRLFEQPISEEARTAATAELVRARLDAGASEDAAAKLVEYAQRGQGISDELRALHVDAMIGMWLKAPEDRKDAVWKSIVEEQSRLSGPWAVRSAIRFEQAKYEARFGSAAARLVRSGNAAYRRKDWKQAASLFEQAADAARSDSRPAVADELDFTRASILTEAEEFPLAIAACQNILKQTSDSRVAAEASLLLAYGRGRLLDASPNTAGAEAYEKSLEDHLRKFAEDETASDAAWMLGALRRQQERYAEAIELYRQIPLEHARGPAAVEQRIELFAEALDAFRKSDLKSLDGRTREEWAAAASREIQEVVSTASTGTGRVTLPQASLLITAAEGLLLLEAPDFRVVDASLQQVAKAAEIVRREHELKTSNEDAEAWQEQERRAAALRIVSSARQQKFDAARVALESLSSADPEELLDVLQALESSAKGFTKSEMASLGQLQLDAISRLESHRESLSLEDQQALDKTHAAALALVGRPSEAIPIYERLLADSGGRETLSALARVLEESGDIENARKRWQEIQRLQKAGSREWLEAAYEVTRLLIAEGKRAEATKLMKTLRIVYPELGGAELRRRFESLETSPP